MQIEHELVSKREQTISKHWKWVRERVSTQIKVQNLTKEQMCTEFPEDEFLCYFSYNFLSLYCLLFIEG